MIRKILAILVSVLFITMIPSVLGVTSESEDIEPCLDVERTVYRGLVLFPHYSDRNITFFAICLSYYQISPTERSSGLILFKWITVRSYSDLYPRFYDIGLLGLFKYVIGFGGGFKVGG